jgi:hypothetical protein
MVGLIAGVGTPLDGAKLRRPASNKRSDQARVIALLWAVDATRGGPPREVSRPEPGPDGICPPALAAAILRFQRFWHERKRLPEPTGVVDGVGPDFSEIGRQSTALPDPPGATFFGIRVKQVAPARLAAPHEASNMVVEPAGLIPHIFGGRPIKAGAIALTEKNAKAQLSCFLFKLEKDGATFWIGVGAPQGVSDFSRAYVFFHPTVVNGGSVHASEGDYAEFRGGWRDSIWRYVEMQGGQMAAARAQIVIVPFMTMRSISDDPSANPFASRPADTLNAVMAATQAELGVKAPAPLVAIGAASFSSGVEHLARFVRFVAPTGLLRETIDFDSAFIVSKTSKVPTVSGVVAWNVTQVPPPKGREAGWVWLPWDAWAKVRAYGDAHSRIGWMTFHTMMLVSALKP